MSVEEERNATIDLLLVALDIKLAIGPRCRNPSSRQGKRQRLFGRDTE